MHVVCPYCRGEAVLVKGKDVYPQIPRLHNSFYWLCKPCDAYVGTHANSVTHTPLGVLANKPLRAARMKAHAAFDPLWKAHGMTRTRAYMWLADMLAIGNNECHISHFDLDTCDRTVEVCNAKTRSLSCTSC
jgi:hypothetical protein